MEQIKITLIILIILIMILTFATGKKEPKKVKPEITSMKKEVICAHDIKKETIKVTAPGTFKSFMDKACITDTTSEAYNQAAGMTVDEEGIYTEGPYKAVAMSNYFGKVGDRFKVQLSSGKTFYAVMTDTKQEKHVGPDQADKVNGSVIEFVVDINSLNREALLTGSLDCIYPGKITEIERI